ncbi:PDR/VanB family oxidoreductase [Nesterenkonia haasae]|uniref:PDR/VanB family oxidoreductase n=1 Tax=Nesterenkonia haasae TaxID=2587813 RepID=UPI001390C88A|nr:PDR/VanB family oxidoreductase [Nesterenkonia haasae]NDK31973.1 oxidoreductase [Nesterenkonia haasae]
MPEQELSVVVDDIEEVASGVRRLRLVSPHGAAMPPWTPGAHIDVVLPQGDVRQYSLCGTPEQTDCVEVAVLLEEEGRGGSKFVHSELSPGDTLHIRGPRSNFAFEEEIEEVVFIAGGIGITPILPMIRAAHAANVSWQLHYAGRSRRGMAFAEELSGLDDQRVHLYASDEGARMNLGTIAAELPAGALVYACGPDRLLDEVSELMGEALAERLRTEHFHARAIEPDTDDSTFTVDLAQSGLELEVPPGRSILEVVREAGVDVPSSCEEGTCGTCETEVLDGDPDHRDNVLGEFEKQMGDTMMICVSRSCDKRLSLEL